MFKNKRKYFFISMISLISVLATMGVSFSADLNETFEVQEMNVTKDNLENSQNDIVQSNELTLNGGKFSDIQKSIDKVVDGGKIYLNGYYSADSNDSVVFINKNIEIIGNSNTILDGKNISCIFSIQESGSGSIINSLKFANGNSGQGGAIIILGKDVTIKNSVFENNYANHSGGAIYTLSIFDGTGKYPTNGNNLLIQNCNFTNNFAQIAAGAVGVYGNNSKIIGCNFVSNKVKPRINHESYGGAIQVGRDEYNLCSDIINCNFINNQAIAHNLNSSHGGVGCVRNGINYQNCKFINNSANQGGALTYHASGNIKDCIFINNSAKLYGGALSTGYANMDMDLKIVNCDFNQNKAPYGGAIQLQGKNIEIQKSTFNKNVASINGGAINIIAKTVTIGGAEFNGNIANVNGGAVYINGNKTTVVDSSFVGNEAIPNVKKLDDGLGGAIYINSSSTTIDKNTFNNNVARNGSAIYYDKSGLNCVISDNVMAENQAWVYALPIHAKNIYYGDICEISTTIFGGNNIAKYGDLSISNAIYNSAKQDKIKINGETPMLGANDNGQLYQDSREYNVDVLLCVTHEDGSIVFNKTLKSDFKGYISNIVEHLKPGKYKVSATHFEDTYYKYITNVTYFNVYPKADLQANKSSNLINVNYGDVVIWTLNITNNGPNNATGIKLKDLIPEGLIILDCNDKNYNQKTGILNIASLNLGESKILVIKTLVNKTGTFINNVTVNGNEYDWNLENNNDSATIKVNSSADLAIEKLVNNTNPNYGDLVKWTLKVTNNGPNKATGVIVEDLLSKGLIYISSTGNYDFKLGLWDIGNLESGKSISMDIVTLVNKTGKIINGANVSGNEYDWNLKNNFVNKSIEVNSSVDLFIIKSVNNTNPGFGELVKWSIIVSNNGPDLATNVQVRDLLDDGLIFVESKLTNGYYDVKSGIWFINSLKPGINETLDIYCKLNKLGSILNIASVNSSEYDWNKSNNQDNESIEVIKIADLSVIKLINNSNPNFGELVKWSIIVSNNGPNSATGVIVSDLLPNSVEYVSFNSSRGVYNPVSGLWDIGNLGVGEELQLDIISKIIKTGNITNFVKVEANEKDNNLVNNNYEKSIYVKSAADISIKKSVSKQEFNVGDLIEYIIEIINNGPDTAQNVKMSELLNNNLKLLGVESSKGIFDNKNNVLTIDSMDNGEKVLVTIKAIALNSGKFENKVNVSSDAYDYNNSNNYDEVYVWVIGEVGVFKSLILDKHSINSIHNVSNFKGECLTHSSALASVGLRETGVPILLLLLVLGIFIGVFPIRISKKR